MKWQWNIYCNSSSTLQVSVETFQYISFHEVLLVLLFPCYIGFSYFVIF
jgi:hypothetical protein